MRHLINIRGKVIGVFFIFLLTSCQQGSSTDSQVAGEPESIVIPVTYAKQVMDKVSEKGSISESGIPEIACKTAVFFSGTDNCDEQSQCNGALDCVCVEQKKHVSWIIAGKQKFKLKFDDPSLFNKKNCGTKFKTSHKCKVSKNAKTGESYSYKVILESCKDGTDPRVVIKKVR